MNGAISGEPSQIASEFGAPLRYNTDLSISRGNDQDGCWSERNLLSLDGGGIRGYWSLLVLERVMQTIAVEERKQGAGQERFDSFYPEPLPDHVTQCVPERGVQRRDNDLDAQKFLPCHYFDIICGSSTGSLIAIMLCRFRMPVSDCLDEYKRMSQSIFGKPRLVSQRNIGIVRWPKYSALFMEEAFKDVTQRRGEKPSTNQRAAVAPLFPTARGTCAMFATTMLRTKTKRPGGSSKTLYLIRSYNHRQRNDIPDYGEIVNFGDAEQMHIWQVARAATAATMYFTELKYKFGSEDPTEKFFFSDGGFGHTNNPTILGIQEIETRFGQDKVGTILSVGTARADAEPGRKGILHRVKEGFAMATSPHHVANTVRYQNRPHYWRLNDETGLDLELDDWKPNGWFTRESLRGKKTLDKIRHGFNAWAVKHENDEMIKRCAEQLVKRRRLRTQDADRWYRYATGASEFRCLSDDCQDSYSSRRRFDDHWQLVHEDSEGAERYRCPDFTVWTYPAAS